MKSYMGIELGSTRIKVVAIDRQHIHPWTSALLRAGSNAFPPYVCLQKQAYRMMRLFADATKILYHISAPSDKGFPRL